MPPQTLFYLLMPLLGEAPISNGGVPLDEVIAGCDANMALIERGLAKYDIKEEWLRRGRLGRAQGPTPMPTRETRTYSAKVYFIAKKCRWDFQDERCIRDEERDIRFWAGKPPPGKSLRPLDYVALIDEVGSSPYDPYQFHPQGIGHGVATERNQLWTVADLVRRVRNDPQIQLSADRQDELIHLVVESKADLAKDEYWVAPKQGYSLVRHLKWALKAPGQPYVQVETEYRQVESGAFVATSQVYLGRLWVKDHYMDEMKRQITLTELRLGEDPDPGLFTLEGLGLPIGARVVDRRTDTTSLFGVNAATEADVDELISQALSRPKATRIAVTDRPSSRRRLLESVGAGLAAIGLAVFLITRRLRRPTG